MPESLNIYRGRELEFYKTMNTSGSAFVKERITEFELSQWIFL